MPSFDESPPRTEQAIQPANAVRYHTPVDLSNLNSSHTLTVLLTGTDKNVLEIGPATGYVTQLLSERGCRVTCIEIDAEAASIAEQFCERMIVGNVETLDLAQELRGQMFDVITLGDVLEHLVEPEKLLHKLKDFLSPTGYVVASIPNIAHGSIRLSLLEGKFDYADLGLLDRTHLRFFTKLTIKQLFTSAGYDINEWRSTVKDPFASEQPVDLANYPSNLAETLRSDPEAATYQYVLKAAPSAHPSPPENNAERGSPVLEAFVRLRQQESGIERLQALVESLEVEAVQRESRLATERERLGSAIEQLTISLAERERALSEQEASLASVRGEAGYVLLTRMRRLLDRLAPWESRRGSILRLLKRALLHLLTLGPAAFLSRLLQPWRWLPRTLELSPSERQDNTAAAEPDRAVHAKPASLRRTLTTNRARLTGLSQRGTRYLQDRGVAEFLRRLIQPWLWLPRTFQLPASPVADGRAYLSLDEQYEVWLRKHAPTADAIAKMQRQAQTFSYRPTVSVIVPVYNPQPEWLDAAIESVRAQYYENWELCLADDCSTDPTVRERLASYVMSDPRIHATYLDKNQGIAAASNSALQLAQGEFVAFLDNDDELKPNALFEVVRLLNKQPELDLIYSDEDKRDPAGNLRDCFFKPDWSPDLLMSVNYIGHLAVYRRAAVSDVGGLRSEYDFSQDYDLVLRVSECTNRIGHIPLPLYTWRISSGSAAQHEDAKPAAKVAAKKALSEALKRRGTPGSVLDGLWPGTYRVKYDIRERPLVSIIIPTKDRAELLANCLKSVLSRTTYSNYEILIINNNSEEQETFDYFAKVIEDGRVRVIDCLVPFNFSVINNFAVKHARGDHVVFLNNDTEVIHDGWLEALLEHSQRPEVGAVGARLLYKNGTVQHAGVLMGLGGVAGHAHLFLPREAPGYHARAQMIQNYSAVTAACMMMRKDVFREVGGFEEKHLAVAFGDVDLCLKVREKDYLVVWTPYAELYHFESASRGYEDTPEKQARFRHEIQFIEERWGKILQNDPYYSPHLTRDYHDFRIQS